MLHAVLTCVVLLAVAHAAWEMVFRPAAFAARMANPVERVLYAAWLWSFAVEAADLPVPVELALRLPAMLLFAWLAWQCLKAGWEYLRGLVASRAR
ncbi:hypothetical protein ACQKJ1_26465 [Methylorubrum rhodesianum]|uniref:hypothetical protein n=1 Tax=Methylorubrum rhodesianum TaxID=29427 RepID=UPI003D0184B4